MEVETNPDNDPLDDKLYLFDAFPSRDVTRMTAKERNWMTTPPRRGLEETALAIKMFGLKKTFRGPWITGELDCLACGQHVRGKETIEKHIIEND